MSALTWLAHSEAERRRTLDVIKLLDEPGTLDEIGVGGIRDAFAELLFPGTSTIQTRARYFLFVPWIYRAIERKGSVSDAAGLARRHELRLIDALMESDETDGVIGREARGRLKTLPSAIYWQGIQTWGIRVAHISLRAYHRRLERLRSGGVAGDDTGESTGALSIWHPELPAAPDGFPGQAELALTSEDADYLRDRVMTRHPGTLLATLVGRPAKRPTVDGPWELGEADLLAAPMEVREQIHHAQIFAQLIHGAQLLYNFMLAEAAIRDEDLDNYRGRLVLWADGQIARAEEFRSWNGDRARFWEIVRAGNPRLRVPAQQFADAWFDLALAGDPHQIAKNSKARTLISNRELALKGRLARLHNRTALEAWKGVSGAEMLRFRWPEVQTIVADISEPLIEIGQSDGVGQAV